MLTAAKIKTIHFRGICTSISKSSRSAIMRNANWHLNAPRKLRGYREKEEEEEEEEEDEAGMEMNGLIVCEIPVFRFVQLRRSYVISTPRYRKKGITLELPAFFDDVFCKSAKLIG